LPPNAVWKNLKGQGPAAHFYHANGFALDAYQPLLEQINKKLALSALALRPTWPGCGFPPKSRDWQLYADDLIAFVEQQYTLPIIGIGHSMGATCTILAAEKRPDLFKALVLIEPAMVSCALAAFFRLMPKVLVNMVGPAKSTLKRQDKWSSREAFRAHCRKFPGYKRFNDAAFDALARAGVVETPDGNFTLVFSKVWEAHNYTQPPNVMDNLQGLTMPCAAIRGKPALFFTDKLWQEWQRRCPQSVFLEDTRYGHLFPLENPQACGNLIFDGLSKIL